MKIIYSSIVRVSVERAIVTPVRGKGRSFGTTGGSGLGLGQPEAMRVRRVLQSKRRGHMYVLVPCGVQVFDVLG